VRKQFERHEIIRTTSQCLYGSGAAPPAAARQQHSSSGTRHRHPNAALSSSQDVAPDHKGLAPTKNLLDGHDDDHFDDDGCGGGGHGAYDGTQDEEEVDDDDEEESDGWECIPNVSHLELCVVPSSREENAPYPTRYKILFVASMDEMGIETTIHRSSTPQRMIGSCEKIS
jgi:hypothetical protein